MKILITGSEGFIGYHLSRELEKRYKITTIDKQYSARKNHHCINIGSEELLVSFLIKNADIVIHCAANVGVDSIASDISKSFENHFIDKIIIDNCRKFDKKLLFFSSSEVYGNSSSCRETDNLSILPSIRGNYALNKLFSERYIALQGMKHIIIRPFNIIGIRQNPTQGVVPKLINNALQGKDLLVDKTLESSAIATPKRAFCAVSDLVKIISRMIENDLFSRELNIFNVGNPDLNFKISEIAELIKELTHSESEICQSEKRTEIAVRSPNVDKLKKFFPDFEFNNDIKSILMDIIEGIKE